MRANRLLELLEMPPPGDEFTGPIYITLDEVPVEASEIAPDGDDSLLEGTQGMFVEGAPLKLSTLPLEARNTRGRFMPFGRVVKRGTVGPDVVAYKRALAIAKYRPWVQRWDTKAGAKFAKDVARFQHDHGIHADGEVGPATHRKLARYIDARGIVLLHQVHTGQPIDRAQASMRAAMVLTVNHAWAIHYTQGPQRMSGVRGSLRPPRFGSFEDCSSEYTWNCFVAGVSDPNRLGYNGQGYTGTISNGTQRVVSPVIGCAALYGRSPYHHVTTVYGRRSDGRWVEHSHGSERGPLWVTHNYRGDFAHYGSPFH